MPLFRHGFRRYWLPDKYNILTAEYAIGEKYLQQFCKSGKEEDLNALWLACVDQLNGGSYSSHSSNTSTLNGMAISGRSITPTFRSIGRNGSRKSHCTSGSWLYGGSFKSGGKCSNKVRSCTSAQRTLALPVTLSMQPWQ